MTLGLTLAITAGFLWSISNILDKLFVERVFRKPLTYLVALLLIDLPIGLGVILWRDLSLVPIDIIRVIVGCAFGLSGSLLYMFALQRDEVSRVVPLFSTAPIILTVFGALFLGERFALASYIGIVLIFIGAWTIQVRGSLVSPFQSRSGWIMLAAATAWATEIVIFKPIVNTAGALTVTTFAITINGAVSFLLLPFVWNALLHNIRSNLTARRAWLVLANEILNIGAYFIYFAAVGVWFASLVSAVSSVQYVFVYAWALVIAPLMPSIFTEERQMGVGLRRVAAIVAIILGVALLQ